MPVTFPLWCPPMSALAAARLTYQEVGATADRLPAGYRHVTRSAPLGCGRETFELCSAAVLSWDMHRRAGLSVHASHPVAQRDADVAFVFGASRFGLVLPCRVVYVVDGTAAAPPDRIRPAGQGLIVRVKASVR